MASEHGCGGAVKVFTLTGRYIKTVTCAEAGHCLYERIYGDGESKGIGINATAAEASGLEKDSIQALFDGSCARSSF